MIGFLFLTAMFVAMLLVAIVGVSVGYPALAIVGVKALSLIKSVGAWGTLITFVIWAYAMHQERDISAHVSATFCILCLNFSLWAAFSFALGIGLILYLPLMTAMGSYMSYAAIFVE